MDENRFDAVAAMLAGAVMERRTAMRRLASGLVVATLSLAAPGELHARKRKKKRKGRRQRGGSSGPCSSWLLAGSEDPGFGAILAAADLTISLDGVNLLDDRDGAPSFHDPIPFNAAIGASLRVVSRINSDAGLLRCGAMFPLFLHCRTTGQYRQLTEHFDENQAGVCDDDRPPGAIWFDQTFAVEV